MSAASDFRAELVKIMPGYKWTIHNAGDDDYLRATGTQSSGSNRMSTLNVVRDARFNSVDYRVRSAGYGRRAAWLHETSDGTLARALRNLQQHYEMNANTYRAHALALAEGRKPKEAP